MLPTDSLSNWIARLALGVALTLGALFVFDSDPADAAVFCVNEPTCLGTPKATIDDALVQAQTNGTTDSVFIGPKATAYTDGDGFSYVSNETVHVHGAGVEETALRATAFANTMTMLSPSSTVEDLTLEIPDLNDGRGLRWDGTASNIAITYDGDEGTIDGSRPEGAAVLEDSTIDIATGRAVTGLNTTSAVIRDTEIKAGSAGVTTSGAGSSINLSRVSITAPRSALQVLGNQTSTVDNSLFRVTSGGNATDSAVSTGNGSNVVSPTRRSSGLARSAA